MATAKLLYRRLDALFGSLKTRRSQTRLVEGFLEDSFANLREDLRLRAGLLYAERRDDFALVKAVGDPGAPVAETLDPGQSPLAEVARHRVYIFRDPDADGSPQRLGLLPRAAAAGLVVGQRPLRSALFFLLELALFVAPAAMLFSPRWRANRGKLLGAAFLLLAGGALYRIDTYLVAYQPTPGWVYFPSVGEMVFTLSLGAIGVTVYVLFVKLFPILSGVDATTAPGGSKSAASH